MGGHGAIMVDIDPGKREAAKQAGAIAAVDGGAADAAQQIKQRPTAAPGRSIDFVGSGETVKLGIDSLDQGRQADHRRPVRRRRHGVDAVLPDARA